MWQITVDAPRERGEPRRQRSITVRGTRAAAERRAPSFHAEVQREGAKKKPTKQTVAGYLDEWLATAVEPRLRPGTSKSYRIACNALRQHIGGIALASLRPLDIEQAYVALRAGGMAGSSVRQIHRVLTSAMRRAVAWELIPHAPTDGVTQPQSDAKPRQALTQEQARALLSAIREHPSGVRLILGLSMGLRAGEVMALQWHDLDLDALARGEPCVATIRRSWSQAAQAYGPTKTGKERRVAVPEVAAEMLRAELLRHAEWRKEAPGWNPDGLVACGKRGRAGYHHMAETVRRICKRLGLPPVVFHGLRHTIASLRLEAGENPAAVADELGHDRAMLLRTYAHVAEHQLIQGAKRVDGMLRG